MTSTPLSEAINNTLFAYNSEIKANYLGFAGIWSPKNLVKVWRTI